MRASAGTLLAGLIVLALWAAPAGLAHAGPALAPAISQDPPANHVLGQPGFITDGRNNPDANRGMYGPTGAAVDARTGRLYVVDSGNNRVLSWPDAHAFSNGQTPDMVIGQPDLSTTDINHGGLSASSLWTPANAAVDAMGNLYVSDEANNRVLVYTAPLTTHAAAGYVLGQPDFHSRAPGLSQHNVNGPNWVALDAAGDVFVADFSNNRVLEFFSPFTQLVDAQVEWGQPNFITNTPNYNGLSAKSLNNPASVAVDASGNLYVADSQNNRVVRYPGPLGASFEAADEVFGQPSLITNTVDNGGLSAGLSNPLDAEVDAQGDVYVVDDGNSRLLEYSAGITATANLVFGQQDFSHGAANQGHPLPDATTLKSPNGVFIDTAGNLFVADYDNNRELEFDTPVPYITPTLTSLSPSTVAAGGPLFSLTVSGAGFVAGSTVRWNGQSRPTAFVSSTQLQASIAAADVAAGGPFSVTVFTPSPGGGTSTPLTMTLYTRASQDTAADTVFGQPNFTTSDYDSPLVGGGANQLSNVLGIVVDRRSGRLYVSDTGNQRILSWPNAAALANAQAADLVIGQPNFKAGQPSNVPVNRWNLSNPVGLALDGQGDLYVADSGDNRVLEYSAPLTTGMGANLVIGQLGSFTTTVPNDGGLGPNSLHEPVGVAVDARGDLFVSDLLNQRVLEYDTPLTGDTTADRVFGEPGFYTITSAAAGPSAVTLAQVAGVAVDARGDLFAADYGEARVLEYTAPLTTGMSADLVIGQPSFITDTIDNGGLSASSLGLAQSVAVDANSAQGDLFVADNTNNRVLEYDAPLSNHAAAARVFGQPGFFSSTANYNGVSPLSLSFPRALALDAHGDLFVADTSNHRLLEYDRPLPLLKLFTPLVRR